MRRDDEADLSLAIGDKFGHRLGHGLHRLGQYRIGDAELIEDLAQMARAGACLELGDRLRPEHRLLSRQNRQKRVRRRSGHLQPRACHSRLCPLASYIRHRDIRFAQTEIEWLPCHQQSQSSAPYVRQAVARQHWS